MGAIEGEIVEEEKVVDWKDGRRIQRRHQKNEKDLLIKDSQWCLHRISYHVIIIIIMAKPLSLDAASYK